jgi:hypothetical protein
MMVIFLYKILIGTPMVNVKTEKIFSPEDEPYKISYGEHAKNFWKWFVSVPKTQHPESDLTGERSANGQENLDSSVFYLSVGKNGTQIERTCNIPNGKGILIPVSVVVVSDKEVPEIPNPTIEDLSKKAKKDQDSVTDMYLRIDGVEYQMEDLSRYRIHTDKFEVNFPKDPIWDVSEGHAMAVADGTYIVSKPLTEGKYTIHWKSSLTCIEREGEPKCIDNNLTQDIKYTIIIK